MPVEHSARRLLLRAELSYRAARIVTHTVELSPSMVFVHTHAEAFVGDTVMLELSFPGLVEPFRVETQVIARRPGNLAGQTPGWTLGFVFYREQEQRWLQTLLGRMSTGPLDLAPPRPYRILLVDDNELTRLAFSLAAERHFGAARSRRPGPDGSLAAQRYSAVTLDIVSDADAALAMARSSRYDLAMVDFFLPLHGGDRLIAELRRDFDSSALPIFAISIGGDDARAATLEAGADLFLPKPIAVRNLFDTLNQLTRPVSPGSFSERRTAV